MPSIREAFITGTGRLGEFVVPSEVIWSDDDDLDIAIFVAYERDGARFAMFLDRFKGAAGPFRRIYVKEYSSEILAEIPEHTYDAAEWIYDAYFLDTADDFPYSRYSPKNDVTAAKTMYVLMTGSEEFRREGARVTEVKNEEELRVMLGHEGLDIYVSETIKKTGRKTWTVFSERGRRLGSAGSLTAAKRRLRQVEYFKRLNESGGESGQDDKPEFTEELVRKIAADAELDLAGYDMNEILLGMPIELEHGTESRPDANVTDDDPLMTLQIVLAHLKEFDKYYSDLLIPAEKAAQDRGQGNVSESRFDGQYLLKSADGSGYYSVDFTTKQPKLDADAGDAYTYSKEEAQAVSERLRGEMGIETEVVPYYQVFSESASFNIIVPMFEDYTNDNFRMSDWYAGPNGQLYGSDGRAMRDFDYERGENQPTQEEYDTLSPYSDVIRGAYKLFKNVSGSYKSGNVIAFGFSGPSIKHGPYAGSDSWWTVEYDCDSHTVSLISDVSGEAYPVSDPTHFRKLISGIVSDLYESTDDGRDMCPACGVKRETCCKCAGVVKHGIDELDRGHGLRCGNGHKWSYQTRDGNVIILI